MIALRKPARRSRRRELDIKPVAGHLPMPLSGHVPNTGRYEFRKSQLSTEPLTREDLLDALEVSQTECVFIRMSPGNVIRWVNKYEAAHPGRFFVVQPAGWNGSEIFRVA